jgi:DNA-binding MarR family transcriptional regulator
VKRDLEPHDLLVGFLLVQSLLEKRSEAFFQPFGISGAQFNILNLLAMHGGGMNQSDLIELLLVGKSSVSIVLNRMVRGGLVRRETHPKDRRQTVLILTAKGRALRNRIFPRYESGVKEVFGSLKKESRVVFLQQLETLYGALKPNDGTEGRPSSLEELLARLTRS